MPDSRVVCVRSRRLVPQKHSCWQHVRGLVTAPGRFAGLANAEQTLLLGNTARRRKSGQPGTAQRLPFARRTIMMHRVLRSLAYVAPNGRDPFSWDSGSKLAVGKRWVAPGDGDSDGKYDTPCSVFRGRQKWRWLAGILSQYMC